MAAELKKRPPQREISQRVFNETKKRQAQSPSSAFDMEDEKHHRRKIRLLRRPDVERITGLSRSTLYEWMKRGDFPQPVKLGTRLVAWRESDISDWLESRETRGAA